MEKYIYPNVQKALELYDIGTQKLSEILEVSELRASTLMAGDDDWLLDEAVLLVTEINTLPISVDKLFKSY
jgi:hypothetical protein